MAIKSYGGSSAGGWEDYFWFGDAFNLNDDGEPKERMEFKERMESIERSRTDFGKTVQNS